MKMQFLKEGGLGVVLALLITGCPQSTPQPPATLEPPRNVLAYAVSPTRVKLSWIPPDNLTNPSFEIERKEGNQDYRPLASGLSSSSHDDTQIVSGGKTFTYRIRTRTANGQSAWVESNPVPVPAPCASNPTDAPTIGCFGPVVSNWPLVATYVALLPNGKVIAWYASDDIGRYRERTDVHQRDRRNDPPAQEDGTMVVLWDPVSNTFEDVSFGNGSQRGVSGQAKGTDLFCAGFTVLADGRFFTAGGNRGLEWGSLRTNLFDPRTNTWNLGSGPTTPDMWRERWYPTVTKLPNGEVMISGGTAEPDPDFVEGSSSSPNNPCRTPSGQCPEGLALGKTFSSIANAPGLSRGIKTQNARGTAFNNAFEIYSPDTGSLRMLEATAADVQSFEHYYPWWHIAPNGLAFLSGAGKQKGLLDWQQGQWKGIWESTSHGIPYDAHRVYGTSVMYEPGKTLVIGGGYAADTYPNGELVIFALNNHHNGKTSLHLELSNSSSTPPVMKQGPNMQYSRTHLNATLLADGKVFVNGGQQDGGENPGAIPATPMTPQQSREWWPKTVNPATVFNIDLAVHQSEIWSPGPENGGTGKFVLGPRAQKPRIYHSASLLLPDATVLTVGGGGCGLCNGNFETGGQDGGYYGRWFGQHEMINQKNHEIYYPAYLFKSDGSLAPRPVITGLSNAASSPDEYPTISYNSQFTVTWNHPDPSRKIEKVTLLALGVPTHAFNQNQRFLSLDIVRPNGLSLDIKAPYDGQYNSPTPDGARNIAPPGFYMLFLIDDRGVPSVARILRIQ